MFALNKQINEQTSNSCRVSIYVNIQVFSSFIFFFFFCKRDANRTDIENTLSLAIWNTVADSVIVYCCNKSQFSHHKPEFNCIYWNCSSRLWNEICCFNQSYKKATAEKVWRNEDLSPQLPAAKAEGGDRGGERGAIRQKKYPFFFKCTRKKKKQWFNERAGIYILCYIIHKVWASLSFTSGSYYKV